MADTWLMLEECYAGEAAVKAATTKYLPATASMEEDGLGAGQAGAAAYTAYLRRAVYRNHLKRAVQGLVGLAHREAPTVTLPEKLEPLRESLTANQESVETVLRKINTQQLLTGRVALLPDVLEGGKRGDLPHLVLFGARRVINWDHTGDRRGLLMAVVDESDVERRDDSMDWTEVKRYRLLRLEGEEYQSAVLEGATDPAGAEWVTPTYVGRKLGFVPLTFVNAIDLVPQPDDPPLYDLASLSLAIYRGEADLRQSLYMQGQDTLVIMGRGDVQPGESVRVGAGAVLDVPIDGGAEYVGVSADGLSEMRENLAADKAEADQLGARVLSSHQGGQESGEALRIRVAASTATLKGIIKAGAAGLEDALRGVAIWVGANPDEVSVQPNLDFIEDDGFSGQELLQYMQAMKEGAPLSTRSLHRILRKKDATELTFEEELEEIEDEVSRGIRPDPEEEARRKEEAAAAIAAAAGGDDEDEEDEEDDEEADAD
jgi:hypothetical protein